MTEQRSHTKRTLIVGTRGAVECEVTEAARITDHGYQKSVTKGICDRCCFDWKDHQFKSVAAFVARTDEEIAK